MNSIRTPGQMLDEAPADHCGLLTSTGPVSFGALAESSRRMASALAGLGVGHADRVAFWTPNSADWLSAFFACARLGAIAVAINTRFRAAELEDILGRTAAKVLIASPDIRDADLGGLLDAIAPEALRDLRAVVVTGRKVPLRNLAVLDMAECLRHAPLPAQDERAAPRDGCVIFTTSGTTSRPKFVLHAQSSVAGHAGDVIARFGYDRPGTVLLQALPYCGVFGFVQAMAAIAAGAPSVVAESIDAQSAARLIHDHQVTHLNGSDDLFHGLLQATPAARPFPNLGLCGYGRFNPALGNIVDEADRRGLRLAGIYGMSECFAFYALQDPDAPAALRAPGGGYPISSGAAVRIRDSETGHLLPPGRTGAIELAGPHLMLGYFGNQEGTRAAMTDDGFLRTGDIGFQNEDGSFVFVGRSGDALRLGGFLVAPSEIEEALEDAGAAAAQVVAVSIDGKPRPVAFIKEGSTTVSGAELQAHCRRMLAPYKVPKRIWSIREFPVTDGPNGVKIQKVKLRELAEANIARESASPGGSP